MSRHALVTGATGFLGAWITNYLLLSQDYEKVTVIVRGPSDRLCESRMRKHLHATKQILPKNIYKKLRVLRGDILDKNIGLSPFSIRSLVKDMVSDVYHSAAIADFNLPDKEIFPTNINGTLNIFNFSEYLSKKILPQEIRVHHISTVAVAGNHKGTFRENSFFVNQKFNNSYEKSKFDAELIARKFLKKGMNVKIYRPAIVTGESSNGLTTNFKMVYQPIHFFSLNLFQKIPAEKSSEYSFVPVDKAAEAIVILSQDLKINKTLFHIVNPSKLTLEKFIEMCSNYLNFSKPKLVPFSKFKKSWLSAAQWKLIEPFIPYFNYSARFDASMTNKILMEKNFRWPNINQKYISNILKFCVKSGFVQSA